MSGQKWMILGGFLAVMVSCFAGYQLYASYMTFESIQLHIPDCDLRKGPCTSKLPTGESITLNIKPTHMPVLTSLLLEVKTHDLTAKQVTVTFKGAEMNMGEFRYDLIKHGNVWSTQTILPTCIHDQMIWHTVVQIETFQKEYNAPFIFINQKPEIASR